VEPGTELSPETIVDSNSWALAAAVREVGAEPVLLGIARDNHASLREKLRLGLTADALITSAGVSAGDRDLVREVLEELGVIPLFWKIDIKPGRPTAFGLAGKVPVFSLPGNPVSSLLTFDTFVRPALLKMLGHRQVLRPLLQATLQAPVAKKAGRVHFLRVRVGRVNGHLTAISAGDQNTGILSTLLHANGVAILPAERENFAAGETIDIHLFEPELAPAEA
jgi:molybdopterin molybdotransferase